MNKIRHLLDKEFVHKYFSEKILPFYPDFVNIKNIDIIPHKKHIWEHTYHVVFEFETKFRTKEGRTYKLPFFCSAHSDEPRKNVYTSLKYLWDKGFSKGYLSIPHPLFYSSYFRGTFYRGVEGRNLYYYIKKNNRAVIDSIIPKTAAWFAKLHHLDTKDSKNFNKRNSRIRTVMPGVEHIYGRINRDYPELLDFYNKAYNIFIKSENNHFHKNKKQWLVHGDAHPENIIKMSEKKIAAIDFTDLCLSDFCRDLGTFVQQLEYMMTRKINDSSYTNDTIKLFLDSYFAKAKTKQKQHELQDRIDTYYNWTSLRTATHFLLKENPAPDRAEELIVKIKNNLNI